jgi:hypothetical protein
MINIKIVILLILWSSQFLKVPGPSPGLSVRTMYSVGIQTAESILLHPKGSTGKGNAVPLHA